MRTAVLAAVLEELADGGVAALGFEGIARRAGVHKTTLYRRWGSIERLLLDAMLELGRERVPIPDTGSLRGDLLAYGTAIATTVTTPQTVAAVRAVASVGDGDAAVVEARRRYWRARLELATPIVERAVERGDLPPDTDPVTTLEALIGPIYFRLLMTGEDVDAALVERLVAVIAPRAGR